MNLDSYHMVLAGPHMDLTDLYMGLTGVYIGLTLRRKLLAHNDFELTRLHHQLTVLQLNLAAELCN